MNGVINGTYYKLTIGFTDILFGTSSGFSVEQSLKDITVRETHNWKKQLPGNRSWSMEFEGKLAYRFLDGTSPAWNKMTLDDVYTKGITDQDRVLITLKGGSGSYYWSGYGYVTSMSIDAPNEDSTSMRISFTGVSDLEIGILN